MGRTGRGRLRPSRPGYYDHDEGNDAVVYFGEPIHSGYVLTKRDHLVKRDQPGARAVEAGAPEFCRQMGIR